MSSSVVASTCPYTEYHPSVPALAGAMPHSAAPKHASGTLPVSRRATANRSATFTRCVRRTSAKYHSAWMPKRRKHAQNTVFRVK